MGGLDFGTMPRRGIFDVKRAKDLSAEANNDLEAYCASLVCKEHVQELMIFAIDARRVELEVHNTLHWLTSHPLAEKEEFRAKEKVLEEQVAIIKDEENLNEKLASADKETIDWIDSFFGRSSGGGDMPVGDIPGARDASCSGNIPVGDLDGKGGVSTDENVD